MRLSGRRSFSRSLAHACLGMALLPGLCQAGTTFSGDGQVTGQVGAGLAAPQARLEARMAAGDDFGLKVSSQNGGGLLGVEKSGRMGIGLSGPQAKVEIAGSGGSGHVAVQLRVGNSSSTTSSSQVVFAYSSTETLRHGIRTRAVDGQNLYNSMDFFLWRSTGQPTALGSYQALSAQNVPAASTGSVHVIPAGNPDVELEVSNGSSTGGGTLHRAAAAAHSSFRIKSQVAYWERERHERAYEEAKSLRHARFRYKAADPKDKPGAPLMRGIIYEDAPASLQGPGNAVLFDARLLLLEAALKEAGRRIAELEGKITVLESRDGGR